jgi:16S rRNA (uracil1498-N3)-methyltransferase
MNVFIAETREENLLLLNDEESWHCSKVLRMREGSRIFVLDGSGFRYEAVLQQVNERQCSAEILSVHQVKKRNQALHLAIAPTKNMDRMEWFVEKATELGIEEISFIWCKNSERKQMKTERLRRVAMSAVKQSMQVFFPILHEPISFSEFLDRSQNMKAEKLIAHCYPDLPRRNLSEIVAPRIITLIGPEGDFMKDEVDSAIKCGFSPVSLGESRLRTETAGIYLAAFFR